ncbi:MAG: hypothetical protein IPM95_01575 [Sphingobacteriales bacterium]|nr:hypothetical protein [Sphingobacteriales bacterium]
MKKTIYLILLLSLSNYMKAQVLFSFVGTGAEQDAMKHHLNVASDEENIASGFQFNSYKINDTLVLSVTGPKTIIRKLTFNNKMKKCDFDQVILPNCDPCSKKQLEVILNDKKMQWKEISKNQYLSSIERKTILTVTHDVNNVCTVMTFKELNINKDAYLGLYKDYDEYTTAEYDLTLKSVSDSPQ